MSVRRVLVGVLLGVGCLGLARDGAAQGSGTPRPAPVVEGSLGWAGFGDEGIVHHTLVGGGARFYVSRRFSLGPELQLMMGPGSDSDLVITGNVVFDVLGPTANRPRRTTPYLVVGGGLFRHSSRFLTGTFASNEGAFTAGIGLRTWLGDRVFAGVDARLGWEPHFRLAGTVGVAIGR